MINVILFFINKKRIIYNPFYIYLFILNSLSSLTLFTSFLLFKEPIINTNNKVAINVINAVRNIVPVLLFCFGCSTVFSSSVFSTVTLVIVVMSSILIVIVVVPSFRATIFPSASTIATFESLLE